MNESEFLNESDKDIKDNILCIGKIAINQCPALYDKCNAVFLPTLLECFSATYPEAMRMRKPSLTSNLNFAFELCGDAAIYFNPLNVDEIAHKIYQVAYDNDLKVRVVKNGIKQLMMFNDYTVRAKKYIQIVTNNIN
ncbi:glycosyltransferase [Candidatus Brachybacter algidus]|uniref:glycosyltransferase n=1 Tax=Candidatus Brachybacter algidus TaxID=2982024 RepID=UPI00257B1A6A|nr:glycosyltransferase [Candidatus Brachybacter algidus]